MVRDGVVDSMTYCIGDPLMKRMKAYLRREVLPMVGSGVVTKSRLEDYILKNGMPEWFADLTARSRKQLLTRAMALLPSRLVWKWSDTAWVVGSEISTPRRLPIE